MSDIVYTFDRKTPARRTFMAFNYLLLTVLVVVTLIPFLNVLSISLSGRIAVASNAVSLWPRDFTLGSYSFILQNKQFAQSFLISVFRTVLGVGISMACTILAAYPLSKTRKQFRSRGFFVMFFLITILFSGGLVPWFMVVKYTGAFNTIWALTLVPAIQVFNILLLMNFIRDLPKEMEESAYMDGAGELQTMTRIILPLTVPALATLMLFTFVFHWNSWFDGYLFINRIDQYPLQTYLYSLLTMPDFSRLTNEDLKKLADSSPRSIACAEIWLTTLPVLFLMPALQRHFQKGIVLGSVKG